MKPLTSEHVLRITRTLALVGSLSAALGATVTGCGASVAPNDADTRDQVSPQPDGQALACVCCPSGDLSGRCAVTSGGSGDRAPMPDDSGAGIAPPPPPQDAGGEVPVMDGGGFEPPVDAGSQPDASVTYLDPPAGQRWCTVNDLFPARPGGPSCPVPGPLPPPSVDF